MPMHPPSSDGSTRWCADLWSLLAALLLFAAVLVGVTSCGGEDLVFPGNLPSTGTPVNTQTPVPT